MKRRVLLQSIAGGALASGLGRRAWGAGELAIMSAGGAWQAAQHDAWYEPFAKKMGITFNEEVTDEGLAKVQAMVQAGNVPIDLVTVETATVLQGGDTGVLQKLDYSRIAPRDGFLEGAALDAGMGLDVYGDVLAYDTTVLKDGPTSVLALFDMAKYPGKRAMRKVVQNNLEWALMADGVAPRRSLQGAGHPKRR